MFVRWIAIALILAACAAPPKTAGDEPSPGLQNAEITVIVTNQHWLDINVYLVRGTHLERLGTAGSQASKVFSISWSRVAGSTIRLAADPIGERTSVSTETLAIRPSSVVEWTIGSGLRQSSVSIY